MSFNEAYKGNPPWDIGRPQKSIIELEKLGNFRNDILDIGCGTGENALFLSKLGYRVYGIDLAENAIRKAKEKANSRNLNTIFSVDNALDPITNHKFNTIIDCGVFHTFNDINLKIYLKNIFNLLEENGTYHFLVFSDKEPGNWGPRRISKQMIQKIFEKEKWQILEVVETDFETNFPKSNVKALRSSIKKNDIHK